MAEQDIQAAPSKWPEPPLRRFGGERPEAPAWFDAALANAPERLFIDVNGAAIETLIWGEKGKPGLLFLHGDSAHADWWSFIIPFLADDYRCVAISWSGMGKSGWRDEGYTMAGYADEAIAIIAATGLDEAGPAKIIAHSMGGVPALIAGGKSDRVGAVITIDTVILPPEFRGEGPTPRSDIPHKIRPSVADALGRFRFLPAQECENLFIVDHLARNALRPATEKDGGEGWVWSVDPGLWRVLDPFASPELFYRTKCPTAYIWGAESCLLTPDRLEYILGIVPAESPRIAIPQAAHHVLADQPLALVASLRTLLAMWPNAAA